MLWHRLALLFKQIIKACFFIIIVNIFLFVIHKRSVISIFIIVPRLKKKKKPSLFSVTVYLRLCNFWLTVGDFWMLYDIVPYFLNTISSMQMNVQLVSVLITCVLATVYGDGSVGE